MAVASGTATAVSNRVSRRQAERWSDQGAQQAPAYQEAPLQAPAADDPIEQLTKLGQLRDSGVLTEEEFASQKAKLLGA